MDVNTRAVFLEFTVYNANVNLFGSVIMLIEFMATGGAVTRSEVKVRLRSLFTLLLQKLKWPVYVFHKQKRNFSFSKFFKFYVVTLLFGNVKGPITLEPPYNFSEPYQSDIAIAE